MASKTLARVYVFSLDVAQHAKLEGLSGRLCELNYKFTFKMEMIYVSTVGCVSFTKAMQADCVSSFIVEGVVLTTHVFRFYLIMRKCACNDLG